MNTRKLIDSFAIAFLTFGTVAFASDQTLTGVVSDNMCGKQHMMKNAPASKCTRECVKAGSDYALVVGDKVYTLKGDKTEIDKFAGEKATIKGTVSGSTVTVTSISTLLK
jgi:hypothetical protein